MESERVGLGEFTDAKPEGKRGVATSVVLSSPQGSVCGTVASAHVGQSDEREQGKIVLQSPILPPTWQASAHKQDSYTNLVSDCSSDKTQVRTQEAGLQKRG
ncbi:hypothetical protein QQF64_025037 [Cirrhinus molitorella]|uniref:Uncharacterized protein n=1 Tax=Cirrhinus molitorella TaxID=172907 RepID=A0ABR3NN62_9TELE